MCAALVLLLAGGLLAVPLVQAQPPARVALVVGNAAYEHAAPLANPKNDAEDMAALLRRLGFQVTAGLDLTDAALKDRVRTFSRQARAAKVALFFYAGHGLQVDGVNYLVPVDAHLAEEADLPLEALALDLVLERMEGGTNLVFLDACRDNPFARSWAGAGRSTSVGRGLTRVGKATREGEASGSGLFIAFATDPDRIAADGEGRNSPFTAALKRHIETPGLEINALLTEVRRTVLDSTGNVQRPWSNSSLSDAFYFVPGAAPPTAALPTSSPNNSVAPRLDPAEELWNQIRASSNAEQLERFMRSFPNSPLVHAARARLDELTGSLTIQTVPNNALIRITSPEMPYQDEMSIYAGEYEITIDAQGYVPFKQHLSVGGDAIYRVSLCKLEEKIETICEDQEVVRYRNERESSYESEAIEYSAKEYYMEQGYRNGLSEYESNWSSRKEEIAESRFCFGVREKAKRSEQNRVLTCEEESGAYIPDSYEHDGCDCIIIGDYDIDECTLFVSWECDLGDVREPYKTTERKCHNEKNLKQVCPDNMVTKLR